MALSTIPAYEPDRVAVQGDHAVVVGAGFAGMLAARVAADAYGTVTVVERDDLPATPVPRDGCPRDAHVHPLWESGLTVLEALFPGVEEELLDRGAVRVDLDVDGRFHSHGGVLAPGLAEHRLISATRPLFEHVLRTRLGERDDVHVRSPCHCVGYLIPDGATVAGVALQDGSAGPSTMAADLVVDATGAASRTPRWLRGHGFPAPPLEEVTIDLAAASTMVDRPPSDRRLIGVWPTAPHTRGAMVLPIERDRWQVTLTGVHGDHPPVEASLFKAFAADLPTSRVGRLLDRHPMVQPTIAGQSVPANRRRRYEAAEPFPDGLAVIGDAVATCDPSYGQASSVAALQALQLHHAMAGDGFEASTYFDRVADVVDAAWTVAVRGDFAYAETSGPKPRATAITNWYLDRLIRRAHGDGRLTDAYLAVASLCDPPRTLARPDVARRVLAPQLSVPRPASFL